MITGVELSVLNFCKRYKEEWNNQKHVRARMALTMIRYLEKTKLLVVPMDAECNDCYRILIRYFEKRGFRVLLGKHRYTKNWIYKVIKV
jgi:hypothetical protein